EVRDELFVLGVANDHVGRHELRGRAEGRRLLLLLHEHAILLPRLLLLPLLSSVCLLLSSVCLLLRSVCLLLRSVCLLLRSRSLDHGERKGPRQQELSGVSHGGNYKIPSMKLAIGSDHA